MDGWRQDGLAYSTTAILERECVWYGSHLYAFIVPSILVFFLLSVLDPLVTVRVPLSACASYLTLYHGLYRLRAHNSLEPKAILRRATQKKNHRAWPDGSCPFVFFHDCRHHPSRLYWMEK